MSRSAQLSAFQQAGKKNVVAEIWPKISYIPARNGCRLHIELKLGGIDLNLKKFVCDAMSEAKLFKIETSPGAGKIITMSRLVSERYLMDDDLRNGVDKYVSTTLLKALDKHEDLLTKELMKSSVVSPFPQGKREAKLSFVSSIFNFSALKM
jgi:hypothetical protein